MNITVDHNVPMPKSKRRGLGESKYPWAQMDIKDSFLFPDTVKKSTATSLAYSAGKARNQKFTIRVLDEGIRCWRTA